MTTEHLLNQSITSGQALIQNQIMSVRGLNVFYNQFHATIFMVAIDAAYLECKYKPPLKRSIQTLLLCLLFVILRQNFMKLGNVFHTDIQCIYLQ